VRPVIPEELATRIEQLDDYHGYETTAEFVRDAVRRRVYRLEAKASVVESAEEHGIDGIGIDDIQVGEIE